MGTMDWDSVQECIPGDMWMLATENGLGVMTAWAAGTANVRKYALTTSAARCASCATAPTPTSKCSVHRSRRQIANWPMRRSRPTSSMPEFLSPRKTWCGSSEGRPCSTMTANSGPISTSTLPTTLPRPRLLPRLPRSCNAPWRCFTPTAHKARLYKHIRETANGGLREVPRTLRLESRDKDRRP